MSVKKTILSAKERDLLESLLASYGSIVTFEQIFNELNIGRQATRNLIAKLVDNGWLVRIKKGIYAVASLESHSFTNISPLVISRVFAPGSYVSFEFALNQHGFFDQLPNSVTAVTTRRSKAYRFQGLDYKYVQAKPEMMEGFQEASIEGQRANVAEFEKALLDLLNFRKDSYTVDLVLEKLKEAKDEIDSQKLTRYAGAYPIVLRRRLGFLLDVVRIESDTLHDELKGVPGIAWLTKGSNIFNAKWRLYYEDRFQLS